MLLAHVFFRILSPIESAGNWKARLGEKTAKNQRKGSERNMNMNSFFFFWRTGECDSNDCRLWTPRNLTTSSLFVFHSFFLLFLFSLFAPSPLHRSSTEQRNRWPPKRLRPLLCLLLFLPFILTVSHIKVLTLFVKDGLRRPKRKGWLRHGWPSVRGRMCMQVERAESTLWLGGSESLWISTFVCCRTSCTWRNE